MENGSLHVLQPSLPGAAVKRHVFVTAGLNDLLTDPENAAEQRARFADLRADLDAFVDGGNLKHFVSHRSAPETNGSPAWRPSTRGYANFGAATPSQAFGSSAASPRATASSR